MTIRAREFYKICKYASLNIDIIFIKNTIFLRWKYVVIKNTHSHETHKKLLKQIFQINLPARTKFMEKPTIAKKKTKFIQTLVK